MAYKNASEAIDLTFKDLRENKWLFDFSVILLSRRLKKHFSVVSRSTSLDKINV